MVSNYKAIREDNIRRRGEDFDDIGRLLSAQLYSDRMHFIFELLQNAEDALARRYRHNPSCSIPNSVTFHLFEDRLEVRHFGQPFDENDVCGISDILRGTKKNDNAQIGKFGIGFKSVYAFTSSPEVHSGDEHFRIEGYIRPYAIKPRLVTEGETLFILPFNHESVQAHDTFEQIGRRLHELRPRTLLFLHHIDEVCWCIEEAESRTYRRTSQQISSNCHKVTISGQTQEHWLMFEKQLEETPSLKVEVAFHLERNEQPRKEQIIPLIDSSPLVVFLPTEIETKLKFLIQGPYRTTPARDNILRDDAFNISLIERTAELVKESLLQIRNDPSLVAMQLLTIDFFNSLPIRPSDFPRGGLFYPIFERVSRAFKQYELLPTTQQGEYISATQAKLARSSDLRKLISETQLQELYESRFKWLTDEITERGRKTAELYSYLQVVLEIEEIEPEDFARKISLSFLEKQPDSWIARFYAFLEGQKALWREGGALRNKPFVRLQDNRHVLAFRGDNISPNAYLPLPPEEDTRFPTVKRDIIDNSMFGKDALGFLRNLGLTEPDAFAEVMENVIPKYEENPITVSPDEHLQDLQKVIRALNSVIFPTSARARKVDIQSRRDRLINKLKKIPFLQAVNAAQPARLSYRKPGELYLASPDLENYFKGNESAWFLRDNINDWNQHLSVLGVRQTVKVTCKKPDAAGHIIISSYRGNHRRGLNGFDPNCEIDELAHALESPTLWKSMYIWNNLVWPNVHHVSGKIEISTTKDFTRLQPPIKTTSKIGRLLQEKAWLPDRFGKFHKPSLLSLDDLPDEFKKNAVIAKHLGLKASAAFEHVLAKLPPKYQETLTKERLDFLIQNLEKIDKLISEQVINHSHQDNSDEEAAADALASNLLDIDYASAFQAAFERLGKAELLDSEEELAPIADPQKRRENLTQQIIQDQRNEPLKLARFRKVQGKKWEGQNTEEVRGFLKEVYGGKCQICSYTFPKHNGEPYFEGVYIVSYTGARWIDRPGNVLCLCSTCCAKFQHGAVGLQENILVQIQKYRASNEGGCKEHQISIYLCGIKSSIRFHERHMLEIQSLLNAASSES